MIYYGFDEVLYGWPRYFDLCNAFEVRWPADLTDAPTARTLNTWRVQSPRGFAWLCHTVPAFDEALVDAYERGTSDITDAMRKGWEATEERAHALAARAIVIETPPEFPPSDVSRALIRAVGTSLAATSKRVVLWESSGLWTTDDVARLTADLEVIPIVDPFLLHAEGEALPARADVGLRVTERAGARRQFERWEMEQLIEWASSYDRAFVLLAGRYKVPHAKELSLLLREEDD